MSESEEKAGRKGRGGEEEEKELLMNHHELLFADEFQSDGNIYMEVKL